MMQPLSIISRLSPPFASPPCMPRLRTLTNDGLNTNLIGFRSHLPLRVLVGQLGCIVVSALSLPSSTISPAISIPCPCFRSEIPPHRVDLGSSPLAYRSEHLHWSHCCTRLALSLLSQITFVSSRSSPIILSSPRYSHTSLRPRATCVSTLLGYPFPHPPVQVILSEVGHSSQCTCVRSRSSRRTSRFRSQSN